MHLRLVQQKSPISRGIRQIVHQRGVLGPVVAARTAIAAQRAGRLKVLDRVLAILEGHVDRRLEYLQPHCGGGFFQRRQLRKCNCVGQRDRAEHHAGLVILRVQHGLGTERQGAAKRGGPYRARIAVRAGFRLAEQPVFRFQRHIGIDKGRATKPAAHDNTHVIIDAQIEHAVCRGQPPALCGRNLRLGYRLG